MLLRVLKTSLSHSLHLNIRVHGARDSIGKRAINLSTVAGVLGLSVRISHAVDDLETASGLQKHPRLHIASLLRRDQIDHVVGYDDVDRPLWYLGFILDTFSRSS